MTEQHRQLLRLGFPVLLTELGVITVSFADTMMVGDYGTDSLAAAAFVNNFFMVPVLMLIGFAAGLTPLIGALYTRKKGYEAGRTFRISLRLNTLLTLALTLIMGVLYFLLDRMGQPEELLPLIRPYYLIVLCTLLPNAVFNVCQQMANGVTDTSMPMWIILGCNAMNILGNYILIFGHWGAPELGLIGAGVSTLISRFAGAIAIFILIRRRNRYADYLAGFNDGSRDRKLSAQVFKTSYPVMIQSGIECLMWSLGAVVCGWYGKIELAAYQVVVTVSQLGFMTYISFGIATSIKVANFMGENNVSAIRKVTHAGLHINLILATLASGIFVALGHHLLGLFTSDAKVIEVGMLLLAPLVIYQYSDAVQIVYANALRGTSNVKPLLTVSLLGYIVVGVPCMLLLAVECDLKSVGVYYSFCVALTGVAVLLYRSFRHTLSQVSISR